MQREVAGYLLGEVLYETEGFVTYVARHATTKLKFLARAPRHDFPAFSDLAYLEHELAVLRSTKVATGILKPILRTDDNRNSYLIYEFFSGLPLDTLDRAPGYTSSFFTLARALLEAVQGCHQHDIVHCAVSPRAILWDPVARDLRLTHFGHALSPGKPPTRPLALTAFSAPERTGQLDVRIGRSSDLYASGAVLYWLLTGLPPFESTGSASELAHSLIAREPVSLRERCTDLPQGLAEFVTKLLAKSPADRPRSASDALAELELIEAQRSAYVNGFAASPPLGMPRLHGRAEEMERLRRALKDVCAGTMRTMLVCGAPGSGKSRLVDEFCSSVSGEQRLLVTSGKFEQYRQRRPYSALLEAVARLLDGFLAATDGELEYWQSRFERIDPALRAVLAEPIPQLHHISGKHPTPPRLGPTETQNRFQQAFRALLEALCSCEHPLVIRIDDLQWSDDETLALLSESFIKARHSYFLLILAYRAREAASAPRVQELITEQAERQDGSTLRIDLERLSPTEIAALCADMVSPCPSIDPLAELTQRYCQGNPLFAMEIVKHLRQTGALSWTPTPQGGFWQLERSSGPMLAGENVVDFIVTRIDALPDTSRRVMMAASCLGHDFDIKTLMLATGHSEAELRRSLAPVCAEGMLVSDSPTAPGGIRETASGVNGEQLTYRFSHDRIQQAAHSLCSQQEREHLHLSVGRALLPQGTLLHADGEAQGSLFSAVEHLNHVDHLLNEDEREKLAEQNLRAGRAAKEMVAYSTATLLLEKALSLLEGSARRRLRFEARLSLTESLYLGAQFERAETMFEEMLAEPLTKDEEVEAHRTRLVLYQHQQRYEEAVTLGLRALSLLGVRLPARPSQPHLAAVLASTLVRLRGVQAASLANIPDRASPRDHTVQNLLVLLWTPTFWINQPLNALVVLKLMEHTMRLGNTSQAPMAYICFAILNHVLLKKYDRALEFQQLAMHLLARGAPPFVASRVRFLSLTFFGPLQLDNRANVQAYQKALEHCLGSGEHVFAGHTIDGITTSLPMHGFRIPEIEQRLEACRLAAERISSKPSLELIHVISAWCCALTRGPDTAEASIEIEQLRFDSYVGVHRMLRMAISYLWDDDATLMNLFHELQGNVVIQSNPLHASFHALFGVLGICRQRPRGGPRNLRKLVTRIGVFERIFPSNFRSLLLLARAERAVFEGAAGAALDFYHRAIAEASKHGHDLVHAISCERISALHEAQGDADGHREYLRVAAHSYGRFGASAKVAQLVRKYPAADMGQALAAARPIPQPIDLRAEALMKAAYAISEEMHGDHLPKNLLRILGTAAGAQRALFVKSQGGTWVVLAAWETDGPGAALEPTPLQGSSLLSEGVVRYVARTRTIVHVHGVSDPRFADDAYLRSQLPRSVLCLPLLHRGELLAVLYLENSVCAEVFTSDQRQLAMMLGQQAAIAIAIADYHRLQIEALQARINPHFLHNSLSVIAELIASQPKKAEAAVLKLSTLYRYVLNSSNSQVVSLEQELAIARDYLTIEQYRFGERLRVIFDIQGPVGQISVPALILQPLVENAVRHGVARKVGPGTVRVEVRVDDLECGLHVADDGPGWIHGHSSGGGFGLQSVLDRLRLLYGNDFELSITKEAGVTVDIRLPIRRTATGRHWPGPPFESKPRRRLPEPR